MTYKPPQADSAESQDHVCTLQSCHGAVVAPLSEVPNKGSSVFSLFSLIKLHLASLPLASSYSHVAVSSVFCAQNIFFGPNAWGPVKYAPLTLGLDNSSCEPDEYTDFDVFQTPPNNARGTMHCTSCWAFIHRLRSL